MKRSSLRLAVVLAVSVLPLIGSCKGKTSTSSNTVVIWHWMTDRDEALHELARRYNAETGADIQFQLYAPSDNYSAKVRVGAQTGTLPDVYGVLGDARDLSSFIEAGHIENLKAPLEAENGAWKNLFYEEALNTTFFKAGNQYNVEEGYYGIPIDVTTIPMIYNKKLFAKAGLDPNKAPATWDEFIEAGKKLKAAGVTGFVSGWGESWLLYSLATDLAHNLMGEAKVAETFKGAVPYTDPQWVEVFGAFEKLQKAKFADSSLVTLGNKAAEQSFASERAGMTFNGSWAVNVYAGMNPQLDYAPFRVPALGNQFPQTVWGGAGSIFSVNAKSANKQKAIDFLRWMSQKNQAGYLAGATRNLPAVKDVQEGVTPLLQGFAEMMKNSIHPNRFPATEEPKVVESFTKGIQSILIAEKTAEQIAKEVQAVKAMVSK